MPYTNNNPPESEYKTPPQQNLSSYGSSYSKQTYLHNSIYLNGEDNKNIPGKTTTGSGAYLFLGKDTFNSVASNKDNSVLQFYNENEGEKKHIYAPASLYIKDEVTIDKSLTVNCGATVYGDVSIQNHNNSNEIKIDESGIYFDDNEDNSIKNTANGLVITSQTVEISEDFVVNGNTILHGDIELNNIQYFNVTQGSTTEDLSDLNLTLTNDKNLSTHGSTYSKKAFLYDTIHLQGASLTGGRVVPSEETLDVSKVKAAEIYIGDIDGEDPTPDNSILQFYNYNDGEKKYIYAPASLYVNNDLTVNGLFTVNNGIQINGDMVLDTNLTAKNADLETLNVSGDTIISGNILFNNELIINDDLIVGRDATIKNDLTVYNDTVIQKDLSVHETISTHDLTVSNDTTVQNNLTVQETLSTKDLTVQETITTQDLTVLNDAIIQEELTTNNLLVNNDAIIQNNLTVKETLSTKDLTVSNDMTIENNLTIQETLSTKDLTVSNDTTVQNNLTVQETLSTKDLTVQETITTQDLTVLNDAIIQEELTTNNLLVNNDTTIQNDLTVEGDFTLKGKMNLGDDALDEINVKSKNMTFQDENMVLEAVNNLKLLAGNDIDIVSENLTIDSDIKFDKQKVIIFKEDGTIVGTYDMEYLITALENAKNPKVRVEEGS